MKLFIANLTNQVREFTYRVAEEQNYRSETIGIGRQTQLPPSLTEDDIAKIIKQYEPHGIRSVNELKNVNDYVGLCYSIDKPIKMDRMIETFETNVGALNDRASDRREEIAATVAHGIAGKMQELGVDVPRTEVEFTEETRGSQQMEPQGFEIVGEGVRPRKAAKLSRRASVRANG